MEIQENRPQIDSSVLPRQGGIDLARIQRLSERLNDLVERIKDNAFLPSGSKISPVFNQAQLAALCGLAPDSMARRLAKAEELGLPAGTPVQTKASQNRIAAAAEDDSGEESDTPNITLHQTESKGRRQWTLAEARQWIKHSGRPFIRPPGVPGAVITTANFKGGVGKTVTSVTLAQGLSLMGYKVLAIDVDPQGSLTSLFGILPTEVSEEMTILPILQPPNSDGYRNSIKESIQKTYWDGLDLIAGSRSLFAGEFYLPSRSLQREPNFDFYEVLNRALNDGTRMEYDYIIIDTMPSLSYVTMNTLWAADAVLMPLPPEGLDIASSSQFWTMFTELAEAMGDRNGANGAKIAKTFQFIGVLPSKVDNTKSHTKSLLKWIQAGYEDLMLNVEIPVTQVVSVSGSEMRTVYDITRYVGSAKTYARAREAYDKLVGEIDHLTRQTCWKDRSK